MMRKKKQKIKFYIITSITLILSIGIFYSPVLAYYIKNPQLLQYLSSNNIFPNATQYFITNLSHFSLSLMKAFSLSFTDEFQADHLIAATLITVCLAYYFLFLPKAGGQKITVFIGICLVASPILFASLFSVNRKPVYYLFLTFGIFVILITEIVFSSVNDMLKPYSYKLRIFITLIIFLFLVKTMSSDFAFVRPNKHPERLLALNGAVVAIEQEISSPNSFQIVSFTHTLEWNFSSYPPLNTIFLLPLEKNLKTKLAKTEDGTGYWGLKQTNQDNFIFLVCIEYSNKHIVEDCTGAFSQSYPNHKVTKNIYTKHPLSVYLAERNIIN